MKLLLLFYRQYRAHGYRRMDALRSAWRKCRHA